MIIKRYNDYLKKIKQINLYDKDFKKHWIECNLTLKKIDYI